MFLKSQKRFQSARKKVKNDTGVLELYFHIDKEHLFMISYPREKDFIFVNQSISHRQKL